MGLPSGFFHKYFPTPVYAFVIIPMCATFITNLIPLELIKLIIFGEKYKFLS
jgi:hypothetical protein